MNFCKMKWTIFISMYLFVAIITEQVVTGQELLFKNFARTNRASRGPDEFEKFFLKASKSVPRIGRRDFDMETYLRNRHYCRTAFYLDPENKFSTRCLQMLDKKFDPDLKDMAWSWYDLADKVEYHPEIFMTRGLLADDELPNDKRLNKEHGTEKNKEITEYRLQPES